MKEEKSTFLLIDPIWLKIFTHLISHIIPVIISYIPQATANYLRQQLFHY